MGGHGSQSSLMRRRSGTIVGEGRQTRAMPRHSRSVTFGLATLFVAGGPTSAHPPAPPAVEEVAGTASEREPEAETALGVSEPPLPASAIRRLGSGLMPKWDPTRVVGFGCDGACYVTTGRALTAKWDRASGRLLEIRPSPTDLYRNADTRIVDVATVTGPSFIVPVLMRSSSTRVREGSIASRSQGIGSPSRERILRLNPSRLPSSRGQQHPPPSSA